MRPKAFIVSAAMEAVSDSEDTSTLRPSAREPDFASSAAATSNRAISATTTLAPSAASRAAIALPMPLLLRSRLQFCLSAS